jgi:hypothetical protein
MQLKVGHLPRPDRGLLHKRNTASIHDMHGVEDENSRSWEQDIMYIEYRPSNNRSRNRKHRTLRWLSMHLSQLFLCPFPLVADFINIVQCSLITRGPYQLDWSISPGMRSTRRARLKKGGRAPPRVNATSPKSSFQRSVVLGTQRPLAVVAIPYSRACEIRQKITRC